MGLQTVEQSPETILERIDMIMHELQALRKTVQAMQTQSSSGDLTQQLYGLGQGTWEEYDLNLDWQRFDS
jgi:prefoldin subunit 5